MFTASCSSADGGSKAKGHCIFSMKSLLNFGSNSGNLKFLSYSDSISSLPYRYSANGNRAFSIDQQKETNEQETKKHTHTKQWHILIKLKACDCAINTWTKDENRTDEDIERIHTTVGICWEASTASSSTWWCCWRQTARVIWHVSQPLWTKLDWIAHFDCYQLILFRFLIFKLKSSVERSKKEILKTKKKHSLFSLSFTINRFFSPFLWLIIHIKFRTFKREKTQLCACSRLHLQRIKSLVIFAKKFPFRVSVKSSSHEIDYLLEIIFLPHTQKIVYRKKSKHSTDSNGDLYAFLFQNRNDIK